MDEYIKKSDLITYITRKRDFINQNSDYYGKDGYHIADDICTDILGYIYSNVISSIEPKTGYWLIDERPESNREIICSNCEQPVSKFHKLPYYCPNCGADMKGDENGR